MRIALYAGSFDPPTNGHKWVIEQMSKNYDEGVIAIGINADKRERFSFSDRVSMLKHIAQPYDNIRIVSFAGQYTADFADALGAQYLIRGIRNPNDLLYENDIRYINECINPNVETIFYTPPKELLQVSSTVVIGLMGCLGWEDEVRDMVPETVMDYLIKRQNHIDWEYLANRFSGTEDIGGILYCYSNDKRFYHNLVHLKTCFMEFDRVKDCLKHPGEVELALLMHDIKYDTVDYKVDNESESAALAVKKFPNVRNLKRLILVTDHKTPPIENDEKYIVDIDLASLGYSQRIFDYNNKLIRQEYSHISDGDYNYGRKTLLQIILDRRQIYHTPEFFDLYENKARENLSRAIVDLSR